MDDYEKEFDRRHILRGRYGFARAIEIYNHEGENVGKMQQAITSYEELVMVMRGQGWCQKMELKLLNNKLACKYLNTLSCIDSKIKKLKQEVDSYQRHISRQRVKVFKNKQGAHSICIPAKKEQLAAGFQEPLYDDIYFKGMEMLDKHG